MMVVFFHVDSEIADENAFLILENIKHLGFRNGNHGTGLDKQETEIIIEVRHFALFAWNMVFFVSMNEMSSEHQFKFLLLICIFLAHIPHPIVHRI